MREKARAGGWERIDRTLLSIQYLRAGAAFAVLIGHGWPGMPDQALNVLGSAMDMFFVMSGFIVVMITQESTRPFDFARDRIERIVPLYWLVTLVCFGLIYSGVLEPQLNPIKLTINLAEGNWPFLLQSLAFFPGASPFEPNPNPLVPQGWTLNYEMMFYALFALALFLPKRAVVPALTFVFAVLVLIGGIAQPASIPVQFWTSPIIFEFIVGLWAGIAWRRGWAFWKFYIVVVLLAVPLRWIAYDHYANFPFEPERLYFLPLVVAIFLSFIAQDRIRPQGLPEWRPLRVIGDASYSIYIAHFIPIILLDRLGRDGPVEPLVYFLGVVGGGFAVGLVTYYAVERPVMRHVKRARERRRLAARI